MGSELEERKEAEEFRKTEMGKEKAKERKVVKTKNVNVKRKVVDSIDETRQLFSRRHHCHQV
jgi:hypothetical protein